MRISFLTFRNKVAKFSRLPCNQVALLSPIMYNLEDRYFTAVENYLDKGEESNLFFDEYSVEKIKKSMGCTYLEAILILNNMENMPENACYIYSPRIQE